MGAWFDSIHVKTDDSDNVQKNLEQLSRDVDCKFLLGPAINGWIGIFPNELGRKEPISAAISKLIPHDIFHLMVHDDGALADYDKAIELKPDSAIYFGNRALAKLRKRDLEGAFSDCNKAIELKSDYANAYNNRGMVKHVKGDLNGALEDYDKAIELKPDFTAARTNRDKAHQVKESQNR